MFKGITHNVLMHQVAKRIVASVVTLIAVSMLFFLLIEILPGDFAEVSAGRISSFAAVDRQRAAYGLDQNIARRYWRWFTQAIQGEFGDSWFTGNAIGPMLWKRLGHTLWLAMLSAMVSLPLGFVLGVLSAIYVGSAFDRTVCLVVLAVTSVPEFVIAYMLMFLFAVHLGLFPVHTFFSDELGFWERVHATILPAMSLAGISIAPILRMTRATVLNIFQAPFMQMAHLKGLTLWRITWRHAIPNVIAPVSTTTVLVIANLVAAKLHLIGELRPLGLRLPIGRLGPHHPIGRLNNRRGVRVKLLLQHRCRGACCWRVSHAARQDRATISSLSTTRATISALAPHVVHALSTTSSRPVRRADSVIVSMSSGTRETGSMTSASTPASARISCARKHSISMLEMPTMVMSLPVLHTRALPNGTV